MVLWSGKVGWYVTTKGTRFWFGWLLHERRLLLDVLIAPLISESSSCSECPLLESTVKPLQSKEFAWSGRTSEDKWIKLPSVKERILRTSAWLRISIQQSTHPTIAVFAQQPTESEPHTFSGSVSSNFTHAQTNHQMLSPHCTGLGTTTRGNSICPHHCLPPS